MSENKLLLRTVNLVRYVTPLREGGSMPAIAEADDGFLYVVKFRGAGQGVKALIAELIGGEIARALGLRIPELVFVTLDEAFGRTEPDEEIQHLLRSSTGLNLGLHYLSGSITFDPLAGKFPDEELSSRIVWLDCLLMNVDRTARNTNMLSWYRDLWLIDHGASLYFHHSWNNWEDWKPFPMIKDHVLLSNANRLEEIDQSCKDLLTPDLIKEIVALVPDEWLLTDAPFQTVEAHRAAYVSFLNKRIAESLTFIKEALNAR